MIALAGIHQSYRHAAALLEQLAGWSACHEVLRQTCYRVSAALARQQQASAPEADAFRQADGPVEFQTDATTVNTTGGWRDMKIAVFAKRPPGAPAGVEQWDQRDLPAPAARVALAAIEEIERFAARWWPWAERLGAGGQKVSVLGDGAEWIWEHAEREFPDRQEVLDIFHAGEHLSDLAKAGCGEGTAEAAHWLKEARRALLASGYAGLCAYVVGSAAWVPDRAALEAAAPGELNYFCGHRSRLGYAERLGQGLPIGSGLIEGACKQMIGRRLKQTGAQWLVENADRMAFLCSLAYSDALPLYFTAV